MTRKRVRVRRGDTVFVLAGKDRGKTGRVMVVIPEKDRVLVEGVNVTTRAVRPNPTKNVKGGLVQTESPIHISNVAVLDPETNAPTRVRYRFLEDGRKVRESTSGSVIDKA